MVTPEDAVANPNTCTIHGKKYDLTYFKNRIVSEQYYGSESWKSAVLSLCRKVPTLSETGADILALQVNSTKKVPEEFDQNGLWNLNPPKKKMAQISYSSKKKFSLLPKDLSDEDIMIAAAVTVARERWRRRRK